MRVLIVILIGLFATACLVAETVDPQKDRVKRDDETDGPLQRMATDGITDFPQMKIYDKVIQPPTLSWTLDKFRGSNELVVEKLGDRIDLMLSPAWGLNQLDEHPNGEYVFVRAWVAAFDDADNFLFEADGNLLPPKGGHAGDPPLLHWQAKVFVHVIEFYDGNDTRIPADTALVVPVNADNDNGSAWIPVSKPASYPELDGRLPESRDFEVSPLPNGIEDDDLVEIRLIAKNGIPSGGAILLSAEMDNRSKIAMWTDRSKTTQIQNPAIWNEETLPSAIFIEGVKEGAAHREVTLFAEITNGQEVIAETELPVTVTPVLNQLKVTGASGVPILDDDDVYFNTKPNAEDAPGATYYAQVDAEGMKGRLEFVQNVRFLNPLGQQLTPAKNNVGAIVNRAGSGGGPSYLYMNWSTLGIEEFRNDGAPGGIDLPFYRSFDANVWNAETGELTDTDSPATQLTTGPVGLHPVRTVVPALSDTSRVLTKDDFVVYAVWSFEDGSGDKTLYPLGNTTWDVTISQTVTKTNDGVSATPAADNRVNSSPAQFQRSNALPPKLDGTVGFELHPIWKDSP